MNTPLDRLPAGDYRREFATLFAAITAAREDVDPGQLDQMQRHLVPIMQRISTNARRAHTDTDARAQFAKDVAEAKTTLRRIMGDNWQPSGDSQAGRALLTRGINPHHILT